MQLNDGQHFGMPCSHMQAFSFQNCIGFGVVNYAVFKGLSNNVIYSPALGRCLYAHGVQLNIVERFGLSHWNKHAAIHCRDIFREMCCSCYLF